MAEHLEQFKRMVGQSAGVCTSFEHSQKHLSVTPRKTSLRHTNSTSDPFSHTHTPPENHAQQIPISIDYRSHQIPHCVKQQVVPVQPQASTFIMKHVHYPSDSTCVWEEHTSTPQQKTPIIPYTTFAQLRCADHALPPHTEQLPSSTKENWTPFPHSSTTHPSAPTYTQHTPKEHSTVPNPTRCLEPSFPP